MKKIAIDIGACVGKITTDFIKKHDTVYAFEPYEPNVLMLRKKFAKEPKVQIFHCAISNFTGKAKLFLNEKHKGKGAQASSLKEGKRNVSSQHFVEVDVIKLSDFIRKQKIECVEILKIDTEGAEFDIFQDLIENNLMGMFKEIRYEDHTPKVDGLEDESKEIKEQLEQWADRIVRLKS